MFCGIYMFFSYSSPLVPYPDEAPAGALLQHTHVLLADGCGSFPVDAHSGREAEPFADAAYGPGVAGVPHHGEADGVILRHHPPPQVCRYPACTRYFP